MDVAFLGNMLRNKAGQVLNPLLPPKTEVFQGFGNLMPNLIFVAPRWDYRSRFVGDAFGYTRFIPAFKKLAVVTYFVPIENKRAITAEIRRLKKEKQRNIVFSSFQNCRDIPGDYLDLSQEGFYLANWYTDDDMFFDIFSKHIANRFNLNVATFEPNLARYQAIGAHAIASQWAGIDECDFLESRRYAACFVGRMYGQRNALVKRLRSEFGNAVFLHDTRDKPISDEAMISAYQNSWLGVDDPLAYDGKTRQIKARIFENASMGCVVATQPNKRLHRYYEPGREILFWETPTDLIAMIRDCIDNAESYKRMARAAYDRTRRDHLYKHRFAKVFDHIAQLPSAAL